MKHGFKNVTPRWLKIVPGEPVRSKFRKIFAVSHHSLMLAGMASLSAIVLFFLYPSFADQVVALSPFSSDQQAIEVGNAEFVLAAAPAALATVAPVTPPVKVVEPSAAPAVMPKEELPTPVPAARPSLSTAEQERVTSWISKRYRVASDAATMLVDATYHTAREIHLDPLLILAVMAIESRFNPFAESPVGAQGLMQVMSKVHRDKFRTLGGVQAALNPVTNIKVGSLILKDYVKRTGSVEGGLKMYVGAGDAETDSGYGSKVLAEYHRLKEVAHGKNAAPKRDKKTDKLLDDTREAKTDERRLSSEPA